MAAKPLQGLRIVNPRATHQAQGLTTLLEEKGAKVLLFPTIEVTLVQDTKPLLEACQRLSSFDWLVLTSRNAVRFLHDFWKQHSREPWPDQLKIAAVGEKTAQELEQRGIQVSLVPSDYVAESLLQSFPSLQGQRILLPQARRARQTLLNGLQDAGALVEQVVLYETVTARPTETQWQALEGGVDATLLTSPSTVRGFVELLSSRNQIAVWKRCLHACIGPVTAQAVIALDGVVDCLAQPHTIEGLVESLCQYVQTYPTAVKQLREGNQRNE